MGRNLVADTGRSRLREAMNRGAWSGAVDLALDLVQRLSRLVSEEMILFPRELVYEPNFPVTTGRSLPGCSTPATGVASPTSVRSLNDTEMRTSAPDGTNCEKIWTMFQGYHEIQLSIVTEMWLFYKQLVSTRNGSALVATQHPYQAVAHSGPESAGAPVLCPDTDPSRKQSRRRTATTSPSGYEAEASQTRSLHPPDRQQLAELYERAQYDASIGPRLYVLASLAAALMESDIQRQDEIVQDLMEMLHGVQQPLLSLYLRAFAAKVVLSAWQNTVDTAVVASEALVRCLVENWIEMVESWLRLSRYGLDFGVALSMETLSRLCIWRQVLAQELRTLVGAQLGALAWMPNLNATQFREALLPVVLEQALRVSDPSNQEYLLDCFIRGFPEEYLAFTLQRILDTLVQSRAAIRRYRLLASLWTRFHQWMQRMPVWVQAIRDLPIVEMGLDAMETMVCMAIDRDDTDRLDACEALIALALRMAAMQHPSLERLTSLFLRMWKSTCSRRPDSDQAPSSALGTPFDGASASMRLAETERDLTVASLTHETQSQSSFASNELPSMSVDLVDSGVVMPPEGHEDWRFPSNQLVRVACRLVRASADWSELLAVPAFTDMLSLLPAAHQYQVARHLAFWIVLGEPVTNRSLREEVVFSASSPDRLIRLESRSAILAWLKPLLHGTASARDERDIHLPSDGAGLRKTAHRDDCVHSEQLHGATGDQKQPVSWNISDGALLCCLVGRFTWDNFSLFDQLYAWVMNASTEMKREVLPVCSATVLSLLARRPTTSVWDRQQLWQRFHGVCSSLVQVDVLQTALFLLDAASLADASPLDSAAFAGDLLTQTLVLVEEESLDSRVRRSILLRFIDVLRTLRRLEEDRLIRLSDQLVHQATTLWVPADQCEALCAVACLYVYYAQVHIETKADAALRETERALDCWEQAFATARRVAIVAERGHLLLDVYRASMYMIAVLRRLSFAHLVLDALRAQHRCCAAQVQQLVRRYGWSAHAQPLRLAWARMMRLSALDESLTEQPPVS